MSELLQLIQPQMLTVYEVLYISSPVSLCLHDQVEADASCQECEWSLITRLIFRPRPHSPGHANGTKPERPHTGNSLNISFHISAPALINITQGKKEETLPLQNHQTPVIYLYFTVSASVTGSSVNEVKPDCSSDSRLMKLISNSLSRLHRHIEFSRCLLVKHLQTAAGSMWASAK